ncbi:MAG TPA: heavy metal sensor histidine kinase [Desulfuromonadales bacterium]|nr:heavy metal sensor histidine kinase [Desulfuromonadales bacterium]
MAFRSVRFQLTLWYALTLAAVLAASGFFWHFYLAREMRNRVDDKLRIIATEVASFHFTTHPDHLFPHETHLGDKQCEGLEAFVRHRNWGEYIQMLNERGEISCATSNLKGFHLPLTKLALQYASQGMPYFETIRTLGPAPIRVLTYPLILDGRITDIVQIGQDLSAMENALERLRLMLLIFSPLAVALLCFGGWFLTGFFLEPVVRITRAARRINAGNLSQRIHVEDTKDELAQLAETFNSMLARLEDSFNRTKQFTADASHELRTPLAILKGETEVALRWGKDPEELRQTLVSNLEEIDRMGRIIEDLLLLAKSEAGELRLDVREFSLGDLIQDLYLQGKTLGEPKSIDISLRLQITEDVRLKGDQFQLHRLLLNLVNNAIKYTPENGHVEIRLAVEGSEAVLAVADSGIGIAAEHLPHLFERFYRVDEARNRAVGGTGLGLAIVKSIAEAHEGRVEIESTPGKGSVFTVRLPLAGPTPQGKKGAR